LSEKKKNNNTMKIWAIKIFFISLILAAGFSVVAEYFTQGLSLFAAFFVLIMIVSMGVFSDLVGVAFATCDQKPFISMSARKVKNAKMCLNLLKKADIVSNFCNDVIGDICGIVSGAAGAAIAIKIFMTGVSISEYVVSIVLSSLIAAATVAGKALGKSYAMRKNKEIVSFIGSLVVFFVREEKLN